MKKISKLLFLAIIALGVSFTACNNDEIDTPDGQKGNTHVSVALKMSSSNGRSATRALPNDYNYIGEWAGRESIQKITVYLVDGTTVNYKTMEVGDGKPYKAMTDLDGDLRIIPQTEEAAIKTTVGQKKVYVVVNGASEVLAHLNHSPVSAFEDAFEKVALGLANTGNATTSETSASKIAGQVTEASVKRDLITMTNRTFGTLNVLPNIKADETIGANVGEGAKNRVTVEVERAVARVMVTKANQDTFVVPVNGQVDQTPLGVISNVTWVLAQGENKLFVQRKADWATPSFDYKGTNYITEAGDRYDYSGLFKSYVAPQGFGGVSVATYADYSNAVSNPNAGAIGVKSLDGEFILPNTHFVASTKAASGFTKGNTAYVLVRAHFAPADIAYADGGSYVNGADFYVGANGKFYTTAANSQDPEKGGVAGQTAAKYVGGKVLYYAWVNPDLNDAKDDWINSPVLRNNIYHIHITGFKNLGTNWNPLFPEDPDNPKDPSEGGNPDPKPKKEYPEGPEEPETPIDPEDPLKTEDTWMSVDVKVLQWKVHSYQIDLGADY